MSHSLPAAVVWITGAGGLIGSHLAKAASVQAPHVKPVGRGRNDLDLTDFSAVRRRFRSDSPHAVIHCAALSKTTACQANPTRARLVNIDTTRYLAELAAEIPLLFFSTDLVFDGRKGNYVEGDPVNPLNAYAETKVIAEQIVLANPRHTVLRTSLNHGYSVTGNRSFNEEMLQSWREGRTLNLFVDEFRNPIPAGITARAVWELLQLNQPGLYHLAGPERLSRYEIGRLIAAHHPQANPRIEAGSLKDYAGAPRSPDTTLNCSKIQSLLSFPLPKFSEWMQDASRRQETP